MSVNSLHYTIYSWRPHSLDTWQQGQGAMADDELPSQIMADESGLTSVASCK